MQFIILYQWKHCDNHHGNASAVVFGRYEIIRNQSTQGLKKKHRFNAHQIKLVNEAQRVSQACCTFSFSKSQTYAGHWYSFIQINLLKYTIEID